MAGPAKRLSDISVFVFGYGPQSEARAACLASLEASDVGRDYVLCIPADDTAQGWKAVHERVLSCPTEFAAVLPDGVRVNEHLRYNLATWRWPRSGDFALGCLASDSADATADVWSDDQQEWFGDDWRILSALCRTEDLARWSAAVMAAPSTDPAAALARLFALRSPGPRRRVRVHYPPLAERVAAGAIAAGPSEAPRPSAFQPRWLRPIAHDHGALAVTRDGRSTFGEARNIVPLVTCMGRRDHLEQTLPGIVREFGRVVLVDWSCPQRSGEWARATFGSAVEVVHVPDEVCFHKTRALNAGLRRSGELGADWVLVLDADTRIAPGLRAACEERARAGQFAIGDRLWPGPRWRQHLGGVLLASYADLTRLGGYDEAFQDYGPEDVEIRCRLRLVGGLGCVDLPAPLVDSLPHSDAMRMQFATQRDLRRATWRNGTLLAARVRSWTGRDLHAVSEIRDLLIGPGCRMIIPVVTCTGSRDRALAAIQAVLEEFGQAVFVEQTCVQGCGDAVLRAIAGAAVVHVPGGRCGAGRDRGDRGDHARDAGARRAAALGADWLLFLDADFVVPAGLRARCEEQTNGYTPGAASAAGPGAGPFRGEPLTLVRATDFALAGRRGDEVAMPGGRAAHSSQAGPAVPGQKRAPFAVSLPTSDSSVATERTPRERHIAQQIRLLRARMEG